jgi:hypothetical protein
MELHDKGEVDLILTTETATGPGGETLAEVPLRFYGAPGGVASRQRPLRIATCRNCLFRPKVIQLLDAVGIPWESAIDSESDGAVEATVSADLAVTTMLEGTAPRDLETVPHGAGLPDLGMQKINMYGAARPRNELVTQLAAVVRHGFGGTALAIAS